MTNSADNPDAMAASDAGADKSVTCDSPGNRQEERFNQLLVLLSMYIGYAVFMIMRMAPVPVSNAILSDPALDIDKGDWGRILAMGTTGAVIGKFLAGYAADRLGGRITFSVGLVVCSLGIAAFSQAKSAWMFQAAFFVALLAKSAGWPGMTRIIGQSFRPTEFGRVWGILSTSSRVGTMVVTFGLGLLIGTVSWPNLLLIASGVGLVAAVAFNVSQASAAHRLAACRSGTINSEADDDAARLSHPLDGTTLSTAIRRFCVCPRFWLIVGSLATLTVLWDFLLFVPIFLRENMGMTERAASVASNAFPLGSLISVLCGGFVFDLLSRRSTAWIMGGLLLTAAGCIGAFYMMPTLSMSNQTAAGMSVVLLFVFGLCIAPCYYIPMSVFSIQFGGPHAGFLVATLDGIAFFVNAIFYWFAGELAEQSWSLFLSALGAVAVVSAVMTFLFMMAEARLAERQVEIDPAS
ncbi:MAG: MFS transporter [Fuerstiella sp.]|nr:MFS transporter [Fuerstiella sp.]